jgi:hypothetical protein
MSHFAIAETSVQHSAEAGQQLGATLLTELSGRVPDAVVVFASARHDYRVLLESLQAHCTPRVMVGCSSAGEFSSGEHLTESACAVAIISEEIAFSAAVAGGLRNDWRRSAAELVAQFDGIDSFEYPYHSAMILTDALAGNVNEMVGELTRLSGARYQFFGGGACDDGRFERTHVFFGTEPLEDAVVALEMRSRKPIGVGIQHGWQTASEPMRVTEAYGRQLVGLDGAPALEAIENHARVTGQPFDAKEPIPFFLHNVLGIETPLGYRLSVPLAVNEDGSLTCAADIDVGSLVRVMRTTDELAAHAAGEAARRAMLALGTSPPGMAFVFDCVATRLRIGRGFDLELDRVREVLGTSRMIGCNTNGQVARADDQFNGFHNCTAVIAVLPS